ncbi:hypothetical protein U1Q18_008408 [Sarracenia purpurea var. burkii]
MRFCCVVGADMRSQAASRGLMPESFCGRGSCLSPCLWSGCASFVGTCFIFAEAGLFWIWIPVSRPSAVSMFIMHL